MLDPFLVAAAPSSSTGRDDRHSLLDRERAKCVVARPLVVVDESLAAPRVPTATVRRELEIVRPIRSAAAAKMSQLPEVVDQGLERHASVRGDVTQRDVVIPAAYECFTRGQDPLARYLDSRCPRRHPI